MHFKTQIIESVSHSFRVPSRPKPPQPHGTLSRQELRRIIADMLG